MLAFRESTTEFLRPVDRRVDLSPKLPLGSGEGRDYIVQSDTITDNQDVNVARRRLGSAGDRAVEEGQAYALAEWLKCSLEDIGQPECLADEPSKLFEDRTFAIGLVVVLYTLDRSGNDADAGKPCEFSLHRAGTKRNRTNNLAKIETLAGVSEERAEDGLPGLSEERRSHRIRW